MGRNSRQRPRHLIDNDKRLSIFSHETCDENIRKYRPGSPLPVP